MSYQRQIPETELAILQLEMLLEQLFRAGFIGHLLAISVTALLFVPYVSFNVVLAWVAVISTALIFRQVFMSQALARQAFRRHYRLVFWCAMASAFTMGGLWSVTFIISAQYQVLPLEPLQFLFVTVLTMVSTLVALSVVVRAYFLTYLFSSVWPIGWYLLVSYEAHPYYLYAGILALLHCAILLRISGLSHTNFTQVMKSDWERENLSRELGQLTASLRERNKELSQAKRQLTELSRQDDLTGLGNRRMVSSEVVAELNRARRSGAFLSLVLLDVDYFKNYNDTYGHPEGDYVLKRLSCMMQQAVSRAGEMAARYGGEEFLLVLPGSDATAATAVAQRLQKMLAVEAIPHAGSEVGSVLTVSQGIATYDGKQEASADQLIKLADEALYQAKERGRNRIVCAQVRSKSKL